MSTPVTKSKRSRDEVITIESDDEEEDRGRQKEEKEEVEQTEPRKKKFMGPTYTKSYLEILNESSSADATSPSSSSSSSSILQPSQVSKVEKGATLINHFGGGDNRTYEEEDEWKQVSLTHFPGLNFGLFDPSPTKDKYQSTLSSSKKDTPPMDVLRDESCDFLKMFVGAGNDRNAFRIACDRPLIITYHGASLLVFHFGEQMKVSLKCGSKLTGVDLKSRRIDTISRASAQNVFL